LPSTLSKQMFALKSRISPFEDKKAKEVPGPGVIIPFNGEGLRKPAPNKQARRLCVFELQKV